MRKIHGTCKFPECNNPHFSTGYCKGHRNQLQKGKNLKPLHERRRPNGAPPIIEYVEMPCPRIDLEGPCHIFKGRNGGVDPDNYAHVRNGDVVKVHVYVWERDVGPVPDGKIIDHQCRVRGCCNVKHLRPVTYQTNTLENVEGHNWQIQKAKTHCKYGHAFDEANTRLARNGKKRVCRTCAREWRERKRRSCRKAVAE